MAANSPAALSTHVPVAAVGIGRWSVVLAASIAGLALAAGGIQAGWPIVISVMALIVHGGLVMAGGWHLYLARETYRSLLRQVSMLQTDQSALHASAAEVAHDMRAPVVTVRSYLELLIDGAFGPLPEAARQAAEQAARASTRAHSLIEDALSAHVARAMPAVAAASARTGAAGDVDLGAVLRDVTASLGADIATTHAHIEIGPLPRLEGGEAAYYRIFENLIQNAIRYHRPGAAPRIEVTARDAGGAIELAVRDDGVGVPAADRERVFLRNARGSCESTGATMQGHGLGLSTVRDLVNALGGSVWIDPDVVDGACVRIRLPR